MTTTKGMSRVLLCALLGSVAPAWAQTVAEPAALRDGPAPARDEARAGAIAHFHRSLAEAIARDDGPRNLAIAAMLRESVGGIDADGGGASPDPSTDPQDRAWRDEANAKLGKDPIGNALLAGLNPMPGVAAPHDAAARWANAEPDNIAPLLFAGNPAEAVLSQAQARHAFDVHWYEQIRAMAAAIARHPELVGPEAVAQGVQPSAQEYAEGLAMNLIAAHAMPAFSAVVDACRNKALDATPTRRADCAALGATLRDHSDIVVAQLIGNAILRNGTPDPALRAEADRFERRLWWQLQQDAATAFGDEAKAPAAFHAMLEDPALHGEQDAIQRRLTAAGIPLDPPADWKPPH